MRCRNILVISASVLALFGCDDGDKTSTDSGTVTPPASSSEIQDKYWDVSAVYNVSAAPVLATTAISPLTTDVIHRFNSDDILEIYTSEDGGSSFAYSETSYTYTIDSTNEYAGTVSYTIDGDDVMCDFEVSQDLASFEFTQCNSGNVNPTSVSESSVDDSVFETAKSEAGAESDGLSVLIFDNDDSDSGELRYSLGGDYPTGKLTFNVKYNSTETQTFYATLFDSETKTSTAAADLAMKASGLQVRVDGSLTSTPGTFATDEWVPVTMTWDSNNNEYSVMVGSQDLGSFTMNNDNAEVAYISFKISSNSGMTVSDTPVYVDDFMVYSDVAGTTLLFGDNFDSYAVDYAFGQDGEIYSSSSFSAIASDAENATSDSSTPSEGEQPADDTTQAALLSDKDDSDSGELRYQLDAEYAQGKLTFNVKYDSDESQTFYATLFDSQTKTSTAAADVALKSSGVQIRQSGSLTSIDGDFPVDEWVSVSITWDYDNDEFHLMIGDQDLGTHAMNNTAKVSYISFKISSNSGMTDSATPVYVDDFAVYSDQSGTTEIFSDDFESYTLPYSFTGGDGTYHSNSFSVDVATTELNTPQ